MSNAGPVQLHVIVTGQVQGVGYRAFALRQAETLRLVGWVRNLSEGDVELLAEGERTTLEKLLSAMRTGPRGSVIIDIRADWGEATGEFYRFEVKPTR